MTRRSPDRYWDESISPVTGCTPAGDGCAHCWAKAMVNRFPSAHGYYVTNYCPPGKGIPRPFDHVAFHAEALDKLAHWRRPRIVALSWLGDLFHPDVTDEQIGRTFAAIDANPRHTYLVLTKRPKRMADCLSSTEGWAGNVWWGASAWDQASADAAIDELAWIHERGNHTWLSYEPALGPLTFRPGAPDVFDWIVVGPETGPGKRPCDEEWVSDIHRECIAYEIPAWVKGLPGVWPHERPEGMVPRG